MTISYLSGLWWIVGMGVCYVLAILLVEAFRHYHLRYLIRRDREARQRHYLTIAKEKEHN